MLDSKISTGSINLILQVAFSKSESIPSYDKKLVNEVLSEAKEHCIMITELVKRASREDDLGLKSVDKVDMTKYCHRSKLTAYKIHVESILRKKRLLLTYHDYRLSLIRELRWKSMNWVPDASLSLSEMEFLKSFDRIMNNCIEDIGVDITKTNVPTEEPIVQVLANVDIGEVYLPSIGVIRILRNTVHLLQRNEVESFLFEGKLSIMYS